MPSCRTMWSRIWQLFILYWRNVFDTWMAQTILYLANNRPLPPIIQSPNRLSRSAPSKSRFRFWTSRTTTRLLPWKKKNLRKAWFLKSNSSTKSHLTYFKSLARYFPLLLLKEIQTSNQKGLLKQNLYYLFWLIISNVKMLTVIS